MDEASVRLLGMALAIGLGAIGPGAGIGMIFGGAVQAMGRNPEAEGLVRTYAILGFALAESLFIFALVFGILIGFGIV